jgi:hypothetical protein
MNISSDKKALQCKKNKNLYIPTGFEPGIFCPVGGHDDHYSKLQGQPTLPLLYVPLGRSKAEKLAAYQHQRGIYTNYKILVT